MRFQRLLLWYMLLVVIVGAFQRQTMVQADRSLPAPPKQASAYELILAMNTLRVSYGLPPLIEDPILNAVAQSTILLTEAVATLVAGLCGGVAQSTPYIGQPAYKQMGARAGYTLLTGLFIGLGGILGYVSFIVELIPRAVLAPILIFVALDIMCQAFLACPAPHAPAVALAYLPSVARLVAINLSSPSIVPVERFRALLATPGKELPEALVTVALGNGFILTAMLWAAFLAEMINRRLRRSALYLVILSASTFFGVVHSSSPDGNVYLPWSLAGELEQAVPLPTSF